MKEQLVALFMEAAALIPGSDRPEEIAESLAKRAVIIVKEKELALYRAAIFAGVEEEL